MPLEHEKRTRRPQRSMYDPTLGVFGDDAVSPLDDTKNNPELVKSASETRTMLDHRPADQSLEAGRVSLGNSDSVLESISRHKKAQVQRYAEFMPESAETAGIQHMHDSVLEHSHADLLKHTHELAPKPSDSAAKNIQKRKVANRLTEHSAENTAKKLLENSTAATDGISESANAKPRLQFDTGAEIKAKHPNLAVLSDAVNLCSDVLDSPDYQGDDENVAVEAVNKGEHSAKELLRTAYRHHKRVSHRNARKHSTKTAKFNTEPSSRGPRHGNSAAAKKSRSKEMQKRRIKRQYADTTRKVRKSVRLIAKSTTKVKLIANKAAAALANPKVLAVIGIVLLVVVIISGLVAITTGIAGEFVQSVVNLSYLADDECIDDAALYYSELEVDMRWSIINVQDEHPDYDEYRFSIGAIGHDPIALIAYLTAVYYDFTFADIRHILDEIFAEQYNLQFIPEVEIRTRTEGDAEVEYEWHILNIVLVSKPFSAVLEARMNSEQKEHFDLLVESRGLRFYIGSPFDFDWLPYVGSRFGWRIHPITGSRNLHLGIDIGQPTGVEIIAAHAGTVTFAGDMGNYGLVIFLVGDDGIETRYAHCNSLLVSTGDVVSEGQVIATVGSTGRSTGPHLHFEFIRNGRHLNPLLFTANGG